MERRAVVTLLLLALLVAGPIALARPATAGADAHVFTQIPCLSYANAGATKYEGTGTTVYTPNGDVVTTCHMTLVFGTPVTEPTWTNPYGPCDLLELPSGRAELMCHYAL